MHRGGRGTAHAAARERERPARHCPLSGRDQSRCSGPGRTGRGARAARKPRPRPRAPAALTEPPAQPRWDRQGARAGRARPRTAPQHLRSRAPAPPGPIGARSRAGSRLAGARVSPRAPAPPRGPQPGRASSPAALRVPPSRRGSSWALLGASSPEQVSCGQAPCARQKRWDRPPQPLVPLPSAGPAPGACCGRSSAATGPDGRSPSGGAARGRPAAPGFPGAARGAAASPPAVAGPGASRAGRGRCAGGGVGAGGAGRRFPALRAPDRPRGLARKGPRAAARRAMSLRRGAGGPHGPARRRSSASGPVRWGGAGGAVGAARRVRADSGEQLWHGCGVWGNRWKPPRVGYGLLCL